MPDIVINPSVGKIDFFTTKGDQSAANSLRLTGTTVLFAGPISASSISTGGGGAFVTSVQPTSNYLSKFTGNSTIANSLVYDNGTNVGIGTTSPADKLHVIGNIRINGGDILNWSGQAFIQTVGASDMFFRPNSTLQMILTAGGNLGIGNGFVNPLAKLHINSTTSGATLLRTDGTSGTLFSVVDDLSDSLMSVNNSAGLPVLEVFADDRIVGGQYGVNDFVVVNNKVGIGTNNPTAKLQVSGSTSTAAAAFLGGNVGIGTTTTTSGLLSLNGTYPQLNINNPSTGSGVVIQLRDNGRAAGAIGHFTSTNYLQFSTTGQTAQITLNNVGNLGIGSTSPGAKLDVVGDLRVKSAGAAITLDTSTTSDGRMEYKYNGTRKALIGVDSDNLQIAVDSGNYLQFRTNSSERMRITNDGNIGIGNSTPRVLLDLAKTNNVGQVLLIGETATNTRTGFGLDSATAGMRIFCPNVISEAIYMGGISTSDGSTFTRNHSFGMAGKNSWLNEQGGNVGIGTSSPSAKLTVIVTNNTGSRIQLGTASTSPFMAANIVNDFMVLTAPYGASPASVSNGGAKWGIKMNGSIDNINIKSKTAAIYAVSEEDVSGGAGYNRKVGLALHTSGFDLDNAERLRINSVGNVGIGTTSPAYKLDVAGSVYSSNYFSVLTAATYGPSDNSAAMQVFGSTGSGGLTNTIKFVTGGSERVRIDNTGNVGIGTSSPSAKLQIGTQTYASAPDATYFVAGNDNFSGTGPVGAISGYPTTANKNQVTASIFDVVSGWEAVNGSHAILRVSAYNVINSTPALTVLCNGNVGIGTTSPLQKLHVVGNVLSSYNILTSVVKISSESDAASYISVDGYTAGLSYAGTYIGLASLVGYGVSANLYIGGGFPIIPAGWSGTISGTAYANVVNLNTSVLLQTSPDGSTWTTRSQTVAPSGTETLTYSVSDSATRLYVRFTLLQSSGGSVGATDCTIQNIIITNLQSLPNKSSISNRFLVDGSGNVGIGTTIPAYKLEVNGTTFLRSNLNAGKTANINTTTAVNGTGGGNREFVTFTGASATGFTGTDNADQGYGYFAATIVSGRSYEVSATMVVTNGTTLDWVTSTVLSSPTVPVQMIQLVPVSNTTYSFVATGNATHFGVGFNRTSGTMTAVVSNFSLKEVGSVLVTSNSNVGIGTTSPDSKLHIISDVAAGTNNYALRLQNTTTVSDARVGIAFLDNSQTASNGSGATIQVSNNGVDGGGNLLFGSLLNGTNTERMRIKSDGNVGIGTTSPAAKLQIIAPDSPGLGILSNNAGQYVYQYLGRTASELEFGIAGASGHFFTGTVAGDAIIKQNSTGKLHLGYGSGAPSITINSSNNVGIGTTSPGNKLEVKGADDATITAIFQSTAGGNAAYNGGIQLGNAASSQNSQIYHNSSGDNTLTFVSNYGSGTGNKFIFSPGGTETVRFQQNGYVGVGTSSPAAMLHVQKSQNSETTVIINNTNAGTAAAARLDLQSHASNYLTLQAYGQNFSGNVCGIAGAKLNTILDNALTANSTGLLIGTTSTNPLYFATANVVKMTLSAGGNLGIGTTSPLERITFGSSDSIIARSSATDFNSGYCSRILFNEGGTGYGYLGFYTYQGGTGGGERMRIAENGNVGIGTTSPTALLNTAVTGQIQIGTSNWPTTFVGKSGARTLIGNDAVLILWNDISTIGANVEASLFLGARGSGVNGATTIAGGGIRGLSEDASTNKGYLKFETNNGSGFAEAMRIKSDGNVGIGTTSPSGKLHVIGETITFRNGSDSQTTHLYIANAANTRAYNLQLNSAGTNLALWGYNSSNAWQNLVNFNYNGNVGIGTTTPLAQLHVASTTAAATLLRADGTSGTLFSVVDDLSDSLMSVNNSAGLPVLEVFADDRIVGGQYGQNDLVVVNNKVGIGTNNPLAKLHVTGSASVPAAVFMGNVGIGTTNPQYKLHVEGSDITLNTENSYTAKILYFRYSNGARIQSDSYLTFYTAGTPTEKMRITATGALLVGNTTAPNPGAATTVSGFAINGSGNDAYISHKIDNGPCAYFRRDGTDGFVLAFYKANSSVGTIAITATTTTYNTTSDYRLKEDIQPLSSGLIRVNSLKPSVYNWKSDGSNGEGFLAHELAEVVPIAVTGQKDAVNKDGTINPQSVDLSKVVPILVAAIQELSAKVKSLEAKVQILESK